jgi:hypothetical protein
MMINITEQLHRKIAPQLQTQIPLSWGRGVESAFAIEAGEESANPGARTKKVVKQSHYPQKVICCEFLFSKQSEILTQISQKYTNMNLYLYRQP